jgi:protein-S-isoprenylcysteine O-methyltransferase Ste14
VDDSTQLVPVSSGLFWRAVLAFLALPTMVAFIVPWLLLPDTWQFHLVAIPVLVVGTVLLLWCVRDFYVAGRGTLAPWAPPKHLVTVGLYRVSRNPMYVAVLLILVGWALGFQSLGLWIYAGCIAIAFHVRVVTYEEPWLARTHGPEWETYRARVPRWLGWRHGAITSGG